jgi:hypothetical protein
VSVIPDDLDDYYDVCDDLLASEFTSKACTLNYPPEKEICPNCKVVKLASGSSNVYKTGGPYPFTTGFCPYCGGVGYKEVPNTESIRLRIYWNKRDWNKVLPQIQIPDAEVMTIGYLTDMNKCQKADSILLVSDQAHLMQYRFALAGEPYPH